jgi:diadenosine tetraphosphatase ApaH/serine/threonine PP2A family protein phosphatase
MPPSLSVTPVILLLTGSSLLPPAAHRLPGPTQIFCLHGGLSPTMDTLQHIRCLDRVQEVRQAQGREAQRAGTPGSA